MFIHLLFPDRERDKDTDKGRDMVRERIMERNRLIEKGKMKREIQACHETCIYCVGTT